MNVLKSAAIVVALGLPCLAFADGSVTISSPADGAKVALTGTKLVYDVQPGAMGDHVHVYVDGEQAALLRQLKGSYTLDKLSAGDHTVCIKVVDKGHTPTGTEKCVKVTAAATAASTSSY